MTVRLVGGGGVRCWFLRMPGPGSLMMSVSSLAAMVRGGALAGGGGGDSAGGKVTTRWARAGEARRKQANPRIIDKAPVLAFSVRKIPPNAKRKHSFFN